MFVKSILNDCYQAVKIKSVTLENAGEEKILSNENWRDTASQVIAAVKYVDREAEILLDDIKPNNIVVEHGRNASVLIPKLIDFGKACSLYFFSYCFLNEAIKQIFVVVYKMFVK